MNTIIQNILVFIAMAFAILFIAKKFFLKKTSSEKACGGSDDCGCH